MTIRSTRIQDTAATALIGRPELSATEVAQASGIPEEMAGRLWQALGFPSVQADHRLFTRRDVDVLRFVRHLFDEHRFDAEVFLQMTRAVGQSLARIATMHATSIAPEVQQALGDPALSEGDVADRVAALAEGLVHSHEPFLGYVWRRHLLAAISQVVASADAGGGGDETSSVGFADLVDFTTLSEQRNERELAALVDRFERIVYQIVPNLGGRVVKMLGDEVMFANPDPHAAAGTALALAEACAADDLLPDARVGVALGPMLAWEGDLYGRTVNLASRLVSTAHPGTALVSAELAQRLAGDDAFALRELREQKLKGIGRTKVWVLRRRGEDDDTRKGRKARR